MRNIPLKRTLTYTGQDFIGTLCSKLEDGQTDEKDVENILKEIQTEMSANVIGVQDSSGKVSKVMQTPERISSLRKHVVLQKVDESGSILHQEDFSTTEEFKKKKEGFEKWYPSKTNNTCTILEA